MRDYHAIYQAEMPELLARLCRTPRLRRLADFMNKDRDDYVLELPGED